MKITKKSIVSLVLILAFAMVNSNVFATHSVNSNKEASKEDKIMADNGAKYHIVMMLGRSEAYKDGELVSITPPVSVFNRTYVDLDSVAPLFNACVSKNDGCVEVTIKDKTKKLMPATTYTDISSGTDIYFVKDSKVYVSIRELSDFSGCNLSYENGVITIFIKPEVTLMHTIFEKAATLDQYIYEAYPVECNYVVNPYRAYSYETMLSDIESLRAMYPDIIRTYSIGASVEGRALPLVEVGKGDKKIFVCGTHHAREYIATTYLMYAIDRYAYCYRNNMLWNDYSVKEILDNVTFCIVPMVNPDGVNLVQNGIYATNHISELSQMKVYEGAKYGYSAWKANINGVDVNWNYDKDWNYEKNKNPRGSNGFNGDIPATEPETIAISNFVDSHSFEAYLSFHTQGEIFYWADSKSNPKKLQEAIYADTGFEGIEDLGTGIGGSFFDYVYRKFDKPTITVELCPYIGNYPYPDADFDRIWNPAKNILLVCAKEIIKAQ